MPSLMHDHDLDARVGGLEDGVGRKWRRHEDQRRVGAGFGDRVLDGVEDRNAVDVLARLAGSHAGDDLGAVLAALFGRGSAPPCR